MDPHGGRYLKGGAMPMKDGCTACHNARAFRPSTVDVDRHAQFSFALDGAHRATPCVACHEEMRSGAAASTLIAAPRGVAKTAVHAEARHRLPVVPRSRQSARQPVREPQGRRRLRRLPRRGVVHAGVAVRSRSDRRSPSPVPMPAFPARHATRRRPLRAARPASSTGRCPPPAPVVTAVPPRRGECHDSPPRFPLDAGARRPRAHCAGRRGAAW